MKLLRTEILKTYILAAHSSCPPSLAYIRIDILHFRHSRIHLRSGMAFLRTHLAGNMLSKFIELNNLFALKVSCRQSTYLVCNVSTGVERTIILREN